MFAASAELFADAHAVRLSLNPFAFTNKMVNKSKRREKCS